MNLLLLTPETVLADVQKRALELRGYSSRTVADIHFAGKPNKWQLRRALLKQVLQVDVVVLCGVTYDEKPLAQLAAICEYVGARLLKLSDLPLRAPETLNEFSRLTASVTITP